MKGKPKPKADEEVHPDAKGRFERVVDHMLHTKPKPKAKRRPDERGDGSGSKK